LNCLVVCLSYIPGRGDGLARYLGYRLVGNVYFSVPEGYEIPPTYKLAERTERTWYAYTHLCGASIININKESIISLAWKSKPGMTRRANSG